MRSRDTKLLILLGAFLLFFLSITSGRNDGIFGIAHAHAEFQSESEELMTGITKIIVIVVTALDILTWVIFKFLDIIMNPVFMFDIGGGSSGGDGPLLVMLHDIWTLTRDLINVCFAVLLVIGAIMTIIKANTETLKNYRAKFVLAVILVNFSWFIPRVVMDVAQVLTYTVYQIPSLISGGSLSTACQVQDGATTRMCDIVLDVKFLEATDDITPGTANHTLVRDPKDPADDMTVSGGTWHCPMEGLVCYYSMPYNSAPRLHTHSAVINGLIVNHARLKGLAHIVNASAGRPGGAEDRSSVRELLRFLIGQIIVLVIHIGLFFPLLAMLVAFFIRIPILWLTMAFMPVVFLGFVIGDKMGNFNPKIVWDKFLAAAFLPVLVAVPFAVGFVLVNAGANSSTVPPGVNELNNALPLLAGIKDFWQLIWMLIAFFVIWSGVFFVFKSDSFISKFTAPIESMGKNLGKFALTAPLALPFIPGPGNTKMAPLQITKNLQNINSLLADGKLNKQDFLNFTGQNLANESNADKAKNAIVNNSTVKTAIQNHVTIAINESLSAEDRKRAITAIVQEVQRSSALPQDVKGMSREDILRGVEKAIQESKINGNQNRFTAATQLPDTPAAGGGAAGAAPPAGGGAQRP